MKMIPLTHRRNSRKQLGTSSRFKGVCWYKASQAWAAQIQVPSSQGLGNGRTTHLGYFASEEDAARAYDAAAREYHGEFAKTNFQGMVEDKHAGIQTGVEASPVGVPRCVGERPCCLENQ